MKVVVYTTSTCPFCEELMNFLKENNIQFEEKSVETDMQAKDEMASKSNGFLGVPFTVITKDDSKEETVIGFDKNKLINILSL